jgi:hypothetical protein
MGEGTCGPQTDRGRCPDRPTESPRRADTGMRGAVSSGGGIPLFRNAGDRTRGVKKARCQADTGLGRRAPWRPEASTRRNVGGAFGGLPFPAPNRNVNPSRSLPFAITLVLQPRHGNHSSPESVCRPTTRRPDAGKTREPFGRFTGFLAVCARVIFEGRIARLRISGAGGTARTR